MPRIPSYPLIGSLSNDDLLVIDDVSQQYATKSVELQSLKGYFNTGQATTTYVNDKVVSGASFNTNTGVLTLTRTDGATVTQDLDGRYALTSSVFSGNYNDLTGKPTIPTDNSQLANGEGYTNNLGIVQSLTTNNSSGAATLVGGVLNIPQYSGGGGGGVTSVATTAPITGGTITGAGTIGITQASGSADGYLSSTDWNTFNSKSTFDGQFSSLSNTPTTIAGYGITDALQLGITSLTALAGNTTTITDPQAAAIVANSGKTSFPGFGTIAGTALEGNTVIPAAYTNSDVDAHLNTNTAGNNEVLSWTGSDYDWVAQSGGGGGDTYDLNAGTKSGNSVPLNLTSGSGTDNSLVNLTEGSNVQLTQTSTNEITISSTGGTVTGAWQTLNRTFTGSELVNAFNGNNTDKITLVTVGANKIVSLGFCTFICKAGTTGNTNYTNTGNALYVIPENTASGWGVSVDNNLLQSPFQDQVSQNISTFPWRSNTDSGNRPVGKNLVLGNPNGFSANVTQGNRDFIIQITYRITNF